MDRKAALVLGATGGIGGEIATALLARGWSVRGLARDTQAAAARWRDRHGTIDWVGGDAMVRDDVVRAALGVSAIVHAVNPPGYRHWDRLVLPMIDNSIAAARACRGARIVLPGTLYNYDAARAPLVDEDTPQEPPTRKGKVRVAMEQRLEAASRDGVPTLIVRAGDFFGPQVRSSWFAQVMVKPGAPIRRIVDPGRPGIGHSWAYLPDLAETVARLMDMDDRLRSFDRVQFEGFWDADGTAMPAAIRRATGNHQLPVKRFPWWIMRLLAPFGGLAREIVEIEPCWRHPMRFDNRRLVALLGAEPRTPIDEALRATLAYRAA